MAVDDRIRFLVREEVQRVLAGAGIRPGELVEEQGLIGRLDDLHTELHALATRITALEDRPPSAPRETAAARTRQAMGK